MPGIPTRHRGEWLFLPIPSRVLLQTAALRQLFDAPLVNGGPDEQAARALAGMLAVFAEFERDILRDRVKAGIAQARQEGRPHGRPATVRVTPIR